MEAQELTVKEWKPWMDRDTNSPVQDPHGNYKGSVLFDEYHSEPVDATFKTEPKVGDKKYGSIVEYKTKVGAVRTKFQREDRPEATQDKGQQGTSSTSWQPRDDKAIRAQWAIGQAVALSIANGDATLTGIEAQARALFAMIDRVKSGPTGYDTFKASKPDTMPPVEILEDEPLPDYPPGW